MKPVFTISQLLTTIVIASALFTPNVLLAAVDEVAPALPIGSSELVNVGGGLIVVVVAIIVLGVIYAKTQGLKTGTGGVINIVATQAIGPKERIAVVEVANKQLLIGMTTTNVQTLHVFEDPVAIVPEQRASFSNRLKSLMGDESK
ncbi:MAG: FliO/MopB family protein [Woeseiaceae bacterium]